MEKQAQPQDSKSSRSRIYGIIIALLVLTNLGSLYLVWERGSERDEMVMQNSNLQKDKLEVEAELTDMLATYDTLQAENEAMATEMEEQKQKILELLEEAEKHKNDAWVIYKLRKETETLRTIMKGYLHTIDSLSTLNKDLAEQKVAVERKLANQRTENTELQQQNEGLAEKVRIGGKLRALDMVSIAQRVKSNGVHRETSRASKANKIKTCFTLDRNEVTEKGKKAIHIRIIDPNGKVLALADNKDNMFAYNGVEGLFSLKREVDYQREEMDVCYYWDVTGDLAAGKYIVEAYAEDYDIGQTSFTLK
ncbi:MAG: hypothetical protein AAGB22_02795 [Bacteroidota bacterium]